MTDTENSTSSSVPARVNFDFLEDILEKIKVKSRTFCQKSQKIL